MPHVIIDYALCLTRESIAVKLYEGVTADLGQNQAEGGLMFTLDD